MFHGETSIEINQNIDMVYKISKDNMVEYISFLRSDVKIVEKKKDFIKLKISDQKFTWILDIFFNDYDKTIKHIQSEGPIKGLEAIWQFKKLDEKKTQITCIHDFDLKKFHIFKKLISQFLYKTQMKPYVDNIFIKIKEKAELM